jgi:hypothetical protein
MKFTQEELDLIFTNQNPRVRKKVLNKIVKKKSKQKKKSK